MVESDQGFVAPRGRPGGGDASERAISLVSGCQVVSALEMAGHRAVLVDPAEPTCRSPLGARRLLHRPARRRGRRWPRAGPLQRLEFPTRAGPAGPAGLAMSKSASKERFLQAGVPTPDYALVHSSDQGRTYGERAAALGFPVVVKPDSQGSSLGVGIADSPRRLGERLAESFALDPFAIVERLIVVASSPWRCSIAGRCRCSKSSRQRRSSARREIYQRPNRTPLRNWIAGERETRLRGSPSRQPWHGNERPRPSRSHARRRGQPGRWR